MRRHVPSRSLSPAGAVVVALALVTLAGGGCLDASNPCDPDADDDVRRTAALSGLVKDQDGQTLAGVPVTIAGHPTPAISGEDGAFRFSDLPPNASDQGYEVVALADEPAIGGRVIAPRLGCEDDVSGLELVVAQPPQSPEVEITQATAPDRLFVAFAAASGSTRYLVEVRAPFETWQPAVIVSEPVLVPDTASLPAGALKDSSSDDEARDFCGAFRYVHPLLDNDNARCAEVVGTRNGDDVSALLAHGSYEVRVRAEAVLPSGLIASQRLPEVVRSAPTGVPGELSLVPTSLMPVRLHPDAETHAEMLRTMSVDAVVPVADGRFAMLGGGVGVDGMMIVGEASVTAPDEYAGSDALPSQGMVYDDASPAAAAELAQRDGVGIAILPAGKWVRVWKRYLDPDTLAARSQVEKVFIGSETVSENHVDQPEPAFAFDLDDAGLQGELRSFSWLVQPEGRVVGDIEVYNPPDGYLLLMRSGYVLLEREAGVGDERDALLQAFADDLDDGSADGAYGSDATGANAMTTGLCDKLGEGALGVDGELGQRTIRVCFDLEGALGETLDLVDVKILPQSSGATSPLETFHLVSDANGDRVLAVRSDQLLGSDEVPFVDLVRDVRTGVRPGAMAQSRLLECGAGTTPSSLADRPVVLVGNRGSLDVSMLAVVGSGGAARVEELAIIGVPGVPARFLSDPDGASCQDPYTWLVLDDGRMIPLDMRAQSLGVPSCGDEPCAIRSSDRAPVGAVSRDSSGKSRVLVGGRGMLGEVGFLRPSSAATE